MKRNNAYFNYPNNYKDECVDHINISIHSKTQLGKLFDPAYMKTINYPFIGKFNSVLSLWYWVRSQKLDDSLRRMTARLIKKYTAEHGSFNNNVPNFKAIIAQATWIKLQNYPSIINEIKQLDPDIKLLSYNVIKSSGLRISTSYGYFIIEIANTIIDAVKNEREPDFSSLVDVKSKSDLCYLEGVLINILGQERVDQLKRENNIKNELEENV